MRAWEISFLGIHDSSNRRDHLPPGVHRADRDASFRLTLKSVAAEAPVAGQGSAAEYWPEDSVDPGLKLLQAKTGEIPKGERPDDDHVDTDHRQHGHQTDE